MMLDETPEERDQRLAALKEATLVERRLRRVEASELKRQSERVQRLAAERVTWVGYADLLDTWGTFETEGMLPRTAELRLAAAAALRELVAALGVEIAADWVREAND
jgi:hypothetical protein